MIKRLGDDCPQKAKHTKCPDGYNEWHAWAERMQRTHRQMQCPACGLWALWLKRPSAERREPPA